MTSATDAAGVLPGLPDGPARLAPHPAAPACDSSVSIWIPATVLTTAPPIELPTVIRPWKNPVLRAGGGLPPPLRAGPQPGLIRRETFLRDPLLPPARRIDEEPPRRAYEAAVDLWCAPDTARAPAAAVAILDAVASRDRPPRGDDSPDRDPAPLLGEIGAVSRALRRPRPRRGGTRPRRRTGEERGRP